MTPHPDHFDLRHFALLRDVNIDSPYICTTGFPLMVDLEQAGYVHRLEVRSTKRFSWYRLTRAGKRLLRILGE